MKHNNLNETIPSCSDKCEVHINSCFGFVFLLINGYWFLYIYNKYIRNNKENIKINL